MPSHDKTDIEPAAIQIELAQTESYDALEKRDREKIPSEMPARSVVADIQKFYLQTNGMPEDAGLQIVDRGTSAMKPAESPSPSPVKSEAETSNPAASAHQMAEVRSGHVFEDDLRLDTRHVWPEDSGRVRSNNLSVVHPEANAKPADPPASSDEPVSAAANSVALVPLPRRRAWIAAEITRHEVNRLSHSKSDDEGQPPAKERSGFAAYRAMVRAHLAAYKPSGGFGSGVVVVAFTLSSGGDVRSAHIIRSSGTGSLEHAVLNSVYRAAPFPNMPSAAKASDRRFVVPFLFH